MNTNLRALIFASTVAATLTITLDTVFAAEPQPAIRLDAVQVTGHRENFDADGNVKAIRLEQVSVLAHKASFVG